MLEKIKLFMKTKRNVVFWILSVFLIVAGAVFLPNFCSIFFSVAGILLLPIRKLQELWKRVFPKEKIKGALCGVLAVAAFVTVPTDSISASTFRIHFLDVGQADAALVECDGHYMLIDGGESSDSSFIYAYLKERDVNHLDYIIATHAHDDHIGGLAGALNYATVGTAYCSVDSYDSEPFSDFRKYLSKQGKEIVIPSVGETFMLGSASVQVLAANGAAENHNNASLVLRIAYGETSFLFTADAEEDVEQFLLDSEYDLKSTVLKVGHHGSNTSTAYRFLRAVSPKYAVISVGEDNPYNHPDENTLSRLADAEVTVYRTDLHGTIICESTGKNISFTVSKNPDSSTFDPPAEEEPAVVRPAPSVDETISHDTDTDIAYVGNRNSMRFHHVWCDSVREMKEENKYYYTGIRDDMIAKGYQPCKNCNP